MGQFDAVPTNYLDVLVLNKTKLADLYLFLVRVSEVSFLHLERRIKDLLVRKQQPTKQMTVREE